MRDAAWALLIGGLAAASPHTGSARLVPSLIGGAIVAGGVWVIRRRGIALPGPEAARASSAAHREPLAIPIDVAGVLCLLGALLAALPALIWLWEEYTISIWRNAHGLFLPVVVYVLARSSLRRARPPFRSDPALAAPFLVIGVGLSWLGANTGLGQIGTVGLMVLAPGLALLLLGREATRCIALPLALLVFLMPLPEGMTDPLGLASATAMTVEPVMHLVGLEGGRVSTLFVAPWIVFGVAANCSGASTFYAGLLVAIVAGRDLPPLPRVLLLLAVWPITVAVNAVRLTLLMVGSAKWGTAFLHSPAHGLSGIATFWTVALALGLVYLAMQRMFAVNRMLPPHVEGETA